MTDTSTVPALDYFFADAYIDADETRLEPVPHRYVHGGFTGTDTRFSIYLPPAEQYQGRFFQHITPTPESEHLGPTRPGGFNKIGFALSSGGYFVETNGGGGTGSPTDPDPTVQAYRANAAAATYSRVVAAEMYGPHRPFGYAYGGSGGGYRTIGAAENTAAVWDGFVPYVIGSPMALPNVFTVRMHAQRLLRDRFDGIVDALEPGGSGQPTAGLSAAERAAYTEVTRMGFPPRSWFGYRTMGIHAFSALYPGVQAIDPSYFTDFWTEDGYLSNAGDPTLQRDRVAHATTIAEPLTGAGLKAAGYTAPGSAAGGVDDSFLGAGAGADVPVAFRLTSAPETGSILGADLLIRDGAAAGQRLGMLSVDQDIAMLSPNDPAVLRSIRPGDAVTIDNTGFLAAQTYHRHQVPGPDYPVWDQYRRPDGSPVYPQRPMLIGPIFAAATAGTVQTGRFTGRMIVVAALLDREAFPWQADWYRRQVTAAIGPEAADGRFRLWYVDNAVHGDYNTEEDPTHTISYVPAVHQALRDLAAWVEDDIAPPATTGYEIVDGQVLPADTVTDRGGVQPLVGLQVNGVARVDVHPGQPVDIAAVLHAPVGGVLTGLDWDLDGSGTFADHDDLEPDPTAYRVRTVTFTEPGTHWVTARVTAHRGSDQIDIYTPVTNLARVRIVVN